MDRCGTYVGARWSTGKPTRSKLVFFSLILIEYALKRKSRAWMRDSEEELDECDSGRAPARVDSKVTDAM
jgi:hypothetical protein